MKTDIRCRNRFLRFSKHFVGNVGGVDMLKKFNARGRNSAAAASDFERLFLRRGILLQQVKGNLLRVSIRVPNVSLRPCFSLISPSHLRIDSRTTPH